VRLPQDTEWGRHEGVLVDPDGNVIRFGSPMSADPGGDSGLNAEAPPFEQVGAEPGEDVIRPQRAERSLRCDRRQGVAQARLAENAGRVCDSNLDAKVKLPLRAADGCFPEFVNVVRPEWVGRFYGPSGRVDLDIITIWTPIACPVPPALWGPRLPVNHEQRHAKRVPPYLLHLFWNVAPAQLDVEASSPFIARRLITSFDPDGLAWGTANLPASAWEHAAATRGLPPAQRALAHNLATHAQHAL